ncbi:uncharacterized protein [Antedon mediterranea]|uniref:uncharacterized protein n=1 Tax=Antedon mediterranea TaxID=105859 RepID=UPI003AF9D38A
MLRPVALGFSSPISVLSVGSESDIKAVISDVTSLLVLSAMNNELHKSSESSEVTRDQQVRLLEATNVVITSLNETIPRPLQPSFTDSEATLTDPHSFKHSESCNSLTSLEFKSCTSNSYSQTSDVFRSCDSQLDEDGSDSATESDIVASRQPTDNEHTPFLIGGESESNDNGDFDEYDNEELKETLKSLKQRLDDRITSALNDAMAWQQARQDDNEDVALVQYLKELHSQYIQNGQVTLSDQSWFSLLVEKALSSSLHAHDIVMLSKEIKSLKRNAEVKEDNDGQAQDTKSVDTAIQTELSLDTDSISSLDSESDDRNMSPDSLLIPGHRHSDLHDRSVGSQRSAYLSLPQQKPKKKLEVPSTLIGQSVDYTSDAPAASSSGCCPFLRCLKRICMH